jgi:hypothetical protein
MSGHDTYKNGDRRRVKAIRRTKKGKAIKVQMGQRKGRMGMTNGIIKEITFS